MGGTAGLMLGISLSTFVGLIDLLFQAWIFEIPPTRVSISWKKSKKYLFHVLRRSICKINLLKVLSERSKKNAEYRMRKQNEARRQVFQHIVAREYQPISIVLIPYFRKLFMNYTERRDLPGKELFDYNLLYHCTRKDMNHQCES